MSLPRSRIRRAAAPLLALVALVLAGLAAAESARAAANPKKQVYGAIAYEPARKAVGYAYDFKSAREAKVEALRQCGEPACEVAVSFRNACGAIAGGPGKPVAVTGATRDEAETKAMRKCAQKSCVIIAWACTK
jgi:hypothetical protein